MKQSTVELLEQGASLVVPTKRLQRDLTDIYDGAQVASGRGCWPAARILTVNAWARELWESSWPDEAVLSDPLAETLWEEEVRADARSAGWELLDLAALAASGREAYRLIQLYRMPSRFEAADGPEAAALGRWIESHEGALGRRGWIEGSTLLGRAARALESGAARAPQRVLLSGFDEMVPALVYLLGSAEERGARVEHLAVAPKASPGLRVEARDGPEEVRLAALWVRRLLESGTSAGRIGVVGLQLEAYGSWVERIFAEELDPPSALPGGNPRDVFDLSYGRPLALEPVVADALALLEIGRGPMNWEVWAGLLSSPYWGRPGEEVSRSLLPGDTGALRAAEWPLREVARRATAVGLEETASVLAALEHELLGCPERGQPSAWVEHFVRVLTAVGWPGSRALGSREHQARASFHEALSRLRSFDALGTPVSRLRSLESLRKLCADPFRVEVPRDTVRVLGALEAAAFEWDHLWILGCHGAGLPPAVRPNPFLPYRLQLQHGVRQACPETQLEWAKRVLGRLLGAAEEVVVSHPLVWQDSDVPPSPLVASLPQGTPALARSASPRQSVAAAPVVLDRVPDEAPPVGDGERLRGSAYLLADQALCPFRAFARHRLRAAPPEVPDRALDPLERGTAVHAALCRLWEGLNSQEELRTLTPEAREKRIEEAAAAGLEALTEGRPELGPGARALESRRLIALLREWVDAELGREPFRVLEREVPAEISLGGLPLRVRIDRVDEVEGGREVLLDYKTGQGRPSRWFEDRPREPQLPLYALAWPGARGIAYGILRRGECTLRELREDGDALAGSAARNAGALTWSDLLARWRRSLGCLAEEVRRGRADVDPVDAEACRTCELTALCRGGIGEDET